MAVLVLGINHKTVPLATLERLAFPPERIPKGLAGVTALDHVHEAVILSTCNRTEVYATVHRFHPAVGSIRHWLSDVTGVSHEELASGMYTFYDAAAARHLFAVASGLDSMVVGEPEILGQVREAFGYAQDEGSARRLLSALFQRALRVGKRARSETAISRHVVSLPQAAARLAAQASGGLSGKTAIVVGAGRMGELVSRALRDAGSERIVVVNRTRSAAAALACRIGAEASGLESLPGLLPHAACAVTVTAATSPLIDRALLEAATQGRSAPLVAIDLGMPRNIDPEARNLPGVELRDIDDLRSIAEEGVRLRRAELPKVQRIVEEEVEDFTLWERSLALGPSIAKLQGWAEEVRREEVEKAARRLQLTDAEREAVDALVRGAMNKLLHIPITRMKELASGEDGQVYLETFQELFDLDAPED